MATLPQVLTQLREKHGLNYADVAFAVGVRITDVIAWESGTQRPTEAELQRLIMYYKRLENQAYYAQSKTNLSDDPFDNNTNAQSNGDTDEDGQNALGKMRKFITGDSSKMTITPATLIKTSVTHASFWVLIAGIVAFVLCLTLTKQPIPTILFGSIPVPLFLVLFLYENNRYKDISIKHTLVTFVIGGALSIILTLIVDNTFRWSGLLLFVAIIEESAKAIISCRYIKKHNVNKILPAMLIGACVGAGFAMIESMKYAYVFYQSEGYESMRQVIIVRALTEFGTHTIWASISAAALVKTSRGRGISYRNLLLPSFLRYFAIPVCLHLLWNTICTYINNTAVFLIITAVVGIIIMIVFLDNGVKEYNRDMKDIYG